MQGNPLAVGTELGSFQITALLGKGGMGEVYRARDSKLKREVAIKILPDEFNRDHDRVSRFQREAEVLASLNHSNIAAIHDLQEAGGSRFLVLELVEGETLAERITRGPVPVDEALNIAKQICEALEAAHEKGIVHRDLKPANIKITPDGKVKVLDFGLAKAFQEQQESDLSNSPTMISAASVPGVILGTAAYMSPEQARGRMVDRRTDIFAFGCVLYEMLTGKRAFDGEDVTDVLGAILRMEPDWTRLPEALPASIGNLLYLCLEKNMKNRRGSATDVRLDIELALKEPSARPPIAAIPAQRGRTAWAIAGLATLAAIAAIGIANRPNLAPAEMRVEINAPATQSPLNFALAPDGRSIVFVGTATEFQQGLWLRRLDKTEPQLLPGTVGADYPFWSPDSRSIGFFAAGKIKRIDVTGGGPTILADTAWVSGGTWGVDGTILLGGGPGGGLTRVAASGGRAVPATKLQPNELYHRSPVFLPDGKRFLFFVRGVSEVQGVYMGFLDGSPPKRLAPAESAGAFLPPDRIVFVSQGALIARKLDLKSVELVGDAQTLADSVAFDGFGLAGFSVSADGRVAYRREWDQRRLLTWVDRSGKPVSNAGQPDTNRMVAPELSPDGRRVAIDRNVQGNRDVWLMDLASGNLARFTFDPTIEGFPVWSPNGTQIAFESDRNGAYHVYLKPTNGVSLEQELFEAHGLQWPLDWSRDGEFLLYYDNASAGDLWAFPMTMTGTERKPIAIATTPFAERIGAFSPDGHWVAYDTNETGRSEVVVQSFPNPASKWQISIDGGDFPRWSANGRELYFIAPDLKMMAADVRVSGTSFEAGTPKPLFQTRVFGGDISAIAKSQYAVSTDGRFLINQSMEESVTTPINLIMNWKPATK